MEKGSSSSSSLGGGADSFNGLRFGKKIYFQGVGSGEEPPRSPAKKGRTAAVQGGQPPRCQVEGCMVDLSGSKAYYCRHKVCGVHSKSPTVIVAGLEQRFCQQCSRFHKLPEFDQGKRSCRRRLAGHNERRRKPPPEPLLSSRYAALSSPSLYDNHMKSGGLVTDWATTIPSYQLPPWQSSSQPNLVQGSTSTRPTYTNQDCFSSALSLLSNQPLDLPANAFLADPTAASIARYSSGPSWDFKTDNSLHDMMSHPANSPYSRELGLARPGDEQDHEIEQPGGYDSSVQHMNWSL